jgi:UDP-N-acetylglucosamine acyltransferase
MAQPRIHPTSIIDPRASLADDVEIGPGCVIDGPVTLGPGNRLIGHVYLVGPLTVGQNNVFYPHACIGFDPQHRQFDPKAPNGGVVIGYRNVFREGCTIHRSTGEKPTTIGNDNYLMCNTHAGHDAVIGNACTLANGALLAGHVVLEDNVVLGGNAAIHQFCRIGRLAMISGLVAIAQDVPPFCTAYDFRQVESLNLVGLRRAGYRQHIPALQEAFRILYLSRHTRTRAVELIEANLGHDPLCAEFVRFLRATKRGITGYRDEHEQPVPPRPTPEPFRSALHPVDLRPHTSEAVGGTPERGQTAGPLSPRERAGVRAD